MWDLHVGDVIKLKTGDKVPADCLIIESFNLKVDGSGLKYFEELENLNYDKSEFAIKNQETDPFLYADTFIQSGYGTAVVCCVG